MADTLGVIICFLIGYFTPIRDCVMKAQNLPSLTLWLIKSILSRPFGCASHFLHALKTAVKTLPSFSNQFKQYYLGDFPKECVNLLLEPPCNTSPPPTPTTRLTVCVQAQFIKPRGTLWNGTQSSAQIFFWMTSEKCPPPGFARFVPEWKDWGGERESYRGQQGSDSVSFSRLLCLLIESGLESDPTGRQAQTLCLHPHQHLPRCLACTLCPLCLLPQGFIMK